MHGFKIVLTDDIRGRLGLVQLCSLKVHFNDDVFKETFPGLLGDPDNIYPWVSSDHETQPNSGAIIKRKEFKPHFSIEKRISRIRQADLLGMINSLLDKNPDRFRELMPGLENREQGMRECLKYSRILKLHEVDFMPLKIENIKWLVFICLASFFFIFYILFYEIYIGYIIIVDKRRRK